MGFYFKIPSHLLPSTLSLEAKLLVYDILLYFIALFHSLNQLGSLRRPNTGLVLIPLLGPCMDSYHLFS